MFEGQEATNVGLNAVAGGPTDEYGAEPTKLSEIGEECYTARKPLDLDPLGRCIDRAFSCHATQTRHRHYLVKNTVEVNDDEAHAVTYHRFVGTEPDQDKPLTVAGGQYVSRLERRQG